MKRTTALVFAIAVASAAYADPPMTQDEAFSQGKTAGDTAANQAIFDSISAAKGAEVMPSYTPSAPASSYWSPAAVVGAQITGGLNKIVDCEGIPSTDAATKNHCEAVRAIKNQPFIKPPSLITATDPLIVKGDSITNNPEAIIGVMTGTYTACTVETQNLGKEKTTESCDEYPTTGNESCTIGAQVTVDADHLLKCLDSVHVSANASCTVGRVIQVDADANYECSRTNSLLNQYNCSKTLNVNVNWFSSCTPGNWVPLVTINRNAYDTIYLEMFCDPALPVAGLMRVRTYAKGFSGACVGWVEAVIPVEQPTMVTYASLAPHWEHACRYGYPANHGPGSCVGDLCSKTFSWGPWYYAATATPTFTKPYHYYTTDESWTNECLLLEGRAE